MSYNYLDAAAWCEVDDASWNAPNLVNLRSNIAQVNAERNPRIGVLFPKSEQPRLCSWLPAAWGPFWIYLPEPADKLTVRLRVGTVENAPVNLYVTCGRPWGAVNAPPANPADWASRDGAQLAVTAIVSTQTFTGIPVPGESSGWVAVYLWTQCEADGSSAVDSGTLGTSTYEAFGAIPLSSPSIASNPPEMVIVLESHPTGNDVSGEMVFQVMHYDDDQDLVWVFPRIDEIHGTVSYADGWYLYDLGVCVIQGLSIEAEVDDLETPSEEALYNAEPTRWQTHQPLVRHVDNYCKRRVPMWSAHPGVCSDTDQDGVTTHDNLWWHCRADRFAHPDPLDTDWQSMAATFVGQEPTESNGYRAIISLAGTRHFDASDFHMEEPDVLLRLAAYHPTTGASIATTPAADIRTLSDFRWLERMTYHHRNWKSLQYNIWGTVYLNSWQFRGALVHNPDLEDVLADIRRLQHFEVILPETDIDPSDYPLVLHIEAKLSANLLFFAVTAGAGITSRMLHES